MVITEVCKIRPDHYTVNFAEGTIQLHSVVQDYSWPGVLVVIRFVAENEKEVVVESVGRDERGHQIARFLVVKRDQVSIPERSRWGMGRFWGLPRALDEEWYRSRGRAGNNVPVPYFRQPFSISSSSSFLSMTDSDEHIMASSSLSIVPDVSWCS